MHIFKKAKDFETGFQQAPIGMAILGPDLRWISLNQEFCSLLGYAHDELWELGYSAVVHTEEREKMAGFREHMLGGDMHTAKIETRYICKDGSIIDVEIRSALVFDEEARPNYFIDIVEDITQLRKARMNARETAENYRLLIENAVDHAIMRIDRDGKINSWNTGAETLFGYTEDEVLGMPSSILFIPEDVANKEDKREMRTALQQGHCDHDRWHARKDGSQFWSSGIITPVKDESGKDNGFVKILRDLTDRKLAQEHSVYLAQHDSLTGLPNRGKFNIELAHAIDEAAAARSPVAVLFIDLDRYKHINDMLGHHIGDGLLVCVARRLTDILGKSALVARLGGDEFGVILKGISSQTDLAFQAGRIIKELSKPFMYQAHEITIGASIGISLYPKDSADPNELLSYADMAMYQAKNNGRSNFQFYTQNLDVEAKRRTTIEEELRHAIERDELYLYYQPQISLADNEMTSIEALLRWKNPRLAMLAPDEFIALADETGLIIPIGRWVLEQACRQLKRWQQSGRPGLRIAVNVSSRQLEEPAFVETVDRILQQTGVAPHYLELEITERLLMKDNLKNNAVLRALKERGIQVSVDDFGTGFSSLSYLKHFPVDALKIDKLFIKCLPNDEHDAAIASAIIGMAHSLNLKVVAEGVETAEQRDFLKNLGCNYGQGYLFSEPVPPDRIA
ncbi:MAG: putative bifunctional diguanylate cyclase/phosphodiesterase [Burkholderiaceae bacterium]